MTQISIFNLLKNHNTILNKYQKAVKEVLKLLIFKENSESPNRNFAIQNQE